MKNKKGFTLIELIVSFTLITVISLAFFRTTLSLQEQQLENIAKNEFKAFTVALNNSIQNDFLTDKILKIYSCGDNCYDITYQKKGIIKLSYDKNSNVITYGTLKEKLPKDFKIVNDFEIVTYKSNQDGFNSYISLNMDLKNNYSSKIDNIKYMYQYDSTEYEIQIDVKYNAVRYILNLYEYDDFANGLKSANGIRYIGVNPNNYVYFNCTPSDDYGTENYNYASNCEKWRIIGVFDVKSSAAASEKPVKRIKLVRDKFSRLMSWDSSDNTVNDGKGINQWGKSGTYEGADLMRILNGYYIRESNTCTYCNDSNQGTCPDTNNCTNIVGQLSTTSLDMIDNVLWYTSGMENTMTLSTMYAEERSSQSGKICEGTTIENGKKCNDNVVRTTTWIGKIGLIYPSDYAYASTNETCASDIIGSNSTCKTNTWLYPEGGINWTISSRPYRSSADSVWTFHMDQGLIPASYTAWVRPSLYLKPEVEIIGGDGTVDSPYKLGI